MHTHTLSLLLSPFSFFTYPVSHTPVFPPVSPPSNHLKQTTESTSCPSGCWTRTFLSALSLLWANNTLCSHPLHLAWEITLERHRGRARERARESEREQYWVEMILPSTEWLRHVGLKICFWRGHQRISATLKMNAHTCFDIITHINHHVVENIIQTCTFVDWLEAITTYFLFQVIFVVDFL